ncbi:hypothetical protein LINGRAHAP2_LOCUS14911 [Linum grandiflorum]
MPSAENWELYWRIHHLPVTRGERGGFKTNRAKCSSLHYPVWRLYPGSDIVPFSIGVLVVTVCMRRISGFFIISLSVFASILVLWLPTSLDHVLPRSSFRGLCLAGLSSPTSSSTPRLLQSGPPIPSLPLLTLVDWMPPISWLIYLSDVALLPCLAGSDVLLLQLLMMDHLLIPRSKRCLRSPR